MEQVCLIASIKVNAADIDLSMVNTCSVHGGEEASCHPATDGGSALDSSGRKDLPELFVNEMSFWQTRAWHTRALALLSL